MGSRGKMRAYTTFMMCCTIFFLFADQNILAPNLSAIAEDFNMSASERDEMLGGYIAFGFFVVGGPLALIVGYLADTVNRPLLFGCVVAFGELATFCAFWVKNYEELFVCRVLTGISIGGATPVIFSMLGDMYPEESRIYVSTLIGISSSAGISGGQLLSGMIGPALGWRAPFMFVAVPALICAALVFFTVRDPPRGDQEQETRRLRELGETLQHAALNPMLTMSSSSLDELEAMENGEHYFVLEQLEPGTDRKNSHSEWVHTPAKTAILTFNYSTDSSSPRGHSGIDLESFVSKQYITASRQPSTRILPVSPLTLGKSDEPDAGPVIVHTEYSERITWKKVRKLFKTRSVLIIFIQGFPGCLPWGMIFVFLNDYFSNDRGMTVAAATAALTAFGVGGLAGQLFGGWAGQHLYNRDPRLQCALMGATTMLSVLPMLYLLNTTYLADVGFYFMTIIAGFMVSMNGPNVRAVLQVCTSYLLWSS
jgi:predicted MFS family arabinose efflux permease